MEIIDSHTHWGPSVSMGTEVTTEELLRQAEQSNVSRIVIFPFPSMALADEGIDERLLNEANRVNPGRYPRASPWHFKISQASLDLHPGVLAIGRI